MRFVKVTAVRTETVGLPLQCAVSLTQCQKKRLGSFVCPNNKWWLDGAHQLLRLFVGKNYRSDEHRNEVILRC
jgi:hypothetical protein